MNDDLKALVGIVALGLMTVYFLFRILKSTAKVRQKRWEAGGALAGFVIVVVFVLLPSYNSISRVEEYKGKVHELEESLNDAKQKLDTQRLRGRVEPNLSDTLVVLAVGVSQPDGRANFVLDARCVDPAVDELKLFFIREGRHVFQNLEKLPTSDDVFPIHDLEEGRDR